MARLCSAAPAIRTLGRARRLHSRPADRRMAPAVDRGWTGQLDRHDPDHGGGHHLQLAVQQRQRQRTNHHAGARGEQHRLEHPDLEGRRGTRLFSASRAASGGLVRHGGDCCAGGRPGKLVPPTRQAGGATHSAAAERAPNTGRNQPSLTSTPSGPGAREATPATPMDRRPSRAKSRPWPCWPRWATPWRPTGVPTGSSCVLRAAAGWTCTPCSSTRTAAPGRQPSTAGSTSFRSRSLSPARWPALRFRASPPTRSVGSAAAMSYEASIPTTSLSSTSWTEAARPIPVAISWTETAWLLPAGDSIGRWRGSAEPVRHLPRRGAVIGCSTTSSPNPTPLTVIGTTDGGTARADKIAA